MEKNENVQVWFDDAICFAKYIAPELDISQRYFGEEPLDNCTKEYNRIMQEVLPKFGIDVIIIPRKQINHEIISASKVRRLYKKHDFKAMERYVPQTTLNYLKEKQRRESIISDFEMRKNSE